MENDIPALCGFVWKHGEKDYSAWEVELKEEDMAQIEQILLKYECEGFSARNCYDSKFSDIFQ